MLKQLQGLTLIELMIASVLAILIIISLMQVYSTFQQNLKKHIAENQLLENSRLAFNYLQHEIQSAGYVGCRSDLSPQDKLIGSSDAQSDALRVRYAEFSGARLQSMISEDTLYVSAPFYFTDHHAYVISNCQSAEVLVTKTASGAQSQRLVLLNPLKNHYAPMTEIGEWVDHTLHVAKTQRKRRDGSNIYALYSDRDEIIEGVDSMQLLFQTNTSALVKADQVTAWENVQGIYVKLQLSSVDLFANHKPIIKEFNFYVRLFN